MHVNYISRIRRRIILNFEEKKSFIREKEEFTLLKNT